IWNAAADVAVVDERLVATLRVAGPLRIGRHRTGRRAQRRRWRQIVAGRRERDQKREQTFHKRRRLRAPGRPQRTHLEPKISRGWRASRQAERVLRLLLTYSIAATDGQTQQVGGAGTTCAQGFFSVYDIFGSAPGHGVVHVQGLIFSRGRMRAVELLQM